MKFNDAIQWIGTAFILAMYVITSWYPHLHPINVLLGFIGAVSFLIWAVRVRNTPQIIVDAAAALVCLIGLIKHFI
jgi:hypothetical protein